jgi:hypothetical protein
MNIIGKHKLNRRTVLRGAGSIAIALPWLEIMGTEKLAHAQAAVPAKRFLSIYTPGGTVAEDFWPTGDASAPVMNTITKPLEPHFAHVLLMKGISMTGIWHKMSGEQHQAGSVSFLTGVPQPGGGQFPKSPSLDQVLATKISRGIKKVPSLQMAVRWATGKSKGLIHPINAVYFSDEAESKPISPQLDPQDIYATLFGALEPGSNNAALIARKRSILDYVGGRYQALSAKLGASDKAKLEQHLTKIREIEQSLETVVGGSACKAPTKVDTTGYNPTTGLMSDDVGGIRDVSTDTLIPAVGKLMTDMMVMAFACDITAVGSLQWTDTEAKHTFPWLNLSEHHHYYQHDGGFKPAECTQIYTWYAEMHAHLLAAMKEVNLGDHTLLDESVIVVGSELSHPPSHEKEDMPMWLMGGGGGLKGGRVLDFNTAPKQGVPHNNLLVSILNLFGESATTFGDPEFCQNPLTGITA